MKSEKQATRAPIEVAVEEPGGLKRRLTVTVPAERVTATRASERAKLAKTVRMKGFRRGKVPISIVEQRYGPLIDERTVTRLIEQAYRQAVDERHLHPVGEPAVTDVDYHADRDFAFRVEFEVMPELKLHRVGGFRIKKPEVAVTDADVERLLEQVRNEHAVWAPAERQPARGDLVAVRIAPVDEQDRVTQEAKSYRLELGAGYALPGVEEAIGTLSVGQNGVFEVSFPQDFEDESRAGSVQRLRIELVEVKEKQLPLLDDDLARQVGDFEDLAALEAAVGEDLQRHAESEARGAVRDRLVDSLIEANPFDVPEATVERYLDQLIDAPEDADKDRIQEARRSVRPVAVNQIKRQMVLDRLIAREGLEASREEVEDRIRDIAERRGVEARKVRSQLAREGRLATLERQLAVDKAFAFLETQSTIE